MSFVEEEGRFLIGFFFFLLFSRAEEDAWKFSTFKDAEDAEEEEEEVKEEERMRAVSFLELARNMCVRFARYFILKSSFSLLIFYVLFFVLFKNFSSRLSYFNSVGETNGGGGDGGGGDGTLLRCRLR